MAKTNDDIHVNKKYRDTVFRKLFGENKGNALSLYNADLYQKRLRRSERLYGKHLLKIPHPHYIVFYNGSEKTWKKNEGHCGCRMPLKRTPGPVNMNGQPQ